MKYTIILGLMGLVLAGALFSYGYDDYNPDGGIVDCFDARGNKIIGERCIGDSIFGSASDYRAVFALILVFMVVTFTLLGWVIDGGADRW